jgi:hypothetical protein
MKTITKYLLFITFFFGAMKSFTQIGISATAGYIPNSNAMLDISSTTKGLLVPRMTTAERITLTATATDGLTVYDITTKSFWYFNSSIWLNLSVGNHWLNSGTDIYNTNTGNVGIGTSLPTGNLHIMGTGVASSINSSIGAHIKMRLTDDNKWGWIRFESQDGSKSFSQRYDLFNSGFGSNYSIFYNTLLLFTIRGDGRVGIGNLTNPTYPLDVVGDINTTGNLRVSGNAGVAGNILKKDALNVMSWQPQYIGFIAQGTAPAISNEQSVPPNTDTKVTVLNNEEFDSNSLYNPTTGDITIATAGIYHIDVKLHIDNADAGTHKLNIDRLTTGGAVFSTIRYTTHEIASSNSDLPIAISADFQFFAGDIVKIVYSHNCTTNQTITGSFFSWVNMHKLN